MHLEQVVINIFSFKDICGWKQSCYYICSVVFFNWRKITKIQNTEDGQHSTVMYSWAATVKRVWAEHSCHPAFGSGLRCQTTELPGISEVPGVPPPAPLPCRTEREDLESSDWVLSGSLANGTKSGRLLERSYQKGRLELLSWLGMLSGGPGVVQGTCLPDDGSLSQSPPDLLSL